jgi:WD40 repeat protein/serine/threonine protein kinase
MFVCPACQAEIDEVARHSGKCPSCGAALRPLAQRTIADVRHLTPTDADLLASNDQTIELPAGGLIDESINIAIRSTVEAGPDNSTPGKSPASSSATLSDPPPIPTPEQAAVKPATVTFGPQQTIEFTGSASAIDESMLTSQWEGGVAASPGNLGATIKQKETISGTYVSSSSLIVKSRHVSPSGKTVKPVASPADAPDYELLNVIGEGGMGVVYAARQSSIARTVALKMLKAQEADAAQRDKFISEAVVTGELDHPNIVPIYDLGANDDGALFYSMKRVKGTPWHKVLQDKTLNENLNILLRVADAVAFAHVNGVIHRDLKPENVMLGDFGEVLVMDWGLARVTAEFPNAASVSQSDSMGGTPAYMAPEMATGPLEKITAASDVYLLGAILYEIVTGKPPHTGKSVMACLFSAAKNQIAPTDKSGELVEIARKAMSTAAEQRHADVQDFQAAVRDYQAHAESLRLLHLAGESLDQGAKSQDYDLYARAIYALEESLTLWPGNVRAKELLTRARVEYAQAALDKGDFDLGASLLDPAIETHQPVLAKLDGGRRERESRQRRIRFLKGAVAALVASVIGIVSVAYVAVSRQRDEAILQRERADVARAEAVKQEISATKGWAQAEKNLEAEAVARAAEMKQRVIAVDARDAAQRAQEAEEYAAYVARIGLTEAKLDENSFDKAVDILAECPIDLRNWEWGRLTFLTQLSERAWRATAPVDTAAFSPDGNHFATGGWDGKTTLWNIATGERDHEMPLGQYVHAVAYDAAGGRLAAGSSDGTVVVYDAATGKPLMAPLAAHKGGVLSVRFSPDGKRLLTAGYDDMARLWDLESGKELQTLEGHTWWVWAAEFSSDGKRIVTAGQDGKAIVWEQPAEGGPEALYELRTEFPKHRGPVYAARFSPDDSQVATAGFDGRVLLWDPNKVTPISVESRIKGDPDPAEPFRELTGHRGPVQALAFSPDGRTLASGAQDNEVILWDVAAGTKLKELRGHASHVRSVEFSPDGALLLSAGRDAQIKLWRPASYGETREIDADLAAGYATLAARFSADGQRIVTASGDFTASLWDAASLARVQNFQEGHDFLASTAVFFTDGTRLATGAGDGTVRLWDAATSAEILLLKNTGRTGAVDVSYDGSQIATGRGGSGDVQIWDAATGERIATLVGHKAEVTAIKFAPSGKLLATGDNNGHGRLWQYDNASDKWLAVDKTLEGHSRAITALAFVDGGARLISSSGDDTCGQWDVSNLADPHERTDLVLKHPDWVSDMVATRDGRLALTSCEDGKLRLWSLADAHVLKTFEPHGNSSAFTSIDVSPDGRLAAAACAAEGTVRLWDLTTGEEITMPGPGGAPRPWLDLGKRGGLVWAARFAPNSKQVLAIGGNDARLLDVATRKLALRFSPHGVVASVDASRDGSRVVTGSWDSTAKIWDAATGRVIAKLDGLHKGPINSVTFSPDGTQVLTASNDGTARLWRAADGAPLNIVLRGHQGRVHQARFSPDGTRILTVGNDKTGRLWDAKTGAPSGKPLVGHRWAVFCGAFSADGRLIITGGEDNTAIVWNADNGEQVTTLTGHTGAVTAVALTPDGSRALTGSEDNSAKLWDAATGKEILSLSGHTGEVTAVEFSPDGSTALTSGRDGRVQLWPTAPWWGESKLQALHQAAR